MKEVTTYPEDVVSGKILACKYTIQACQRHLDDIATGHERGLRFDSDRALAVIGFFENFLRHSKGRWSGTPLILEPWQRFIIGSLYGWIDAEGLNRFSRAYIEVPRKNGKTQIGSGSALLHLDFLGEPVAEVYFAATKKDQAKIGFDEAVRMTRKSVALKRRTKIGISSILVPESDSIARPLSSDKDTQDGLNVSFALIDEYHAHPTSEILDVLDTGTGARENPLIMIITTAGFSRQTPCFKLRRAMTKILAGSAKDDATFSIIYTIDRGDKWDDPKVWPKANPNLGVSFSHKFLEKQCRQAKIDGGTSVTNFKTKHLNVWTKGEQVWIPEKVLPTAFVPEEEFPDLSSVPCYGGLDMASTSDLTALSLVWPYESGYFARSWYFLPEDAIERHLAREGSDVYEQMRDLENVIITPGNVTDYDAIRRLVSGHHIINGSVKYDEVCIATRYDVDEIARDRYNSTQITIDLVEDGLNVVPYAQTVPHMSSPTKTIERLIHLGKFRHLSCPVTQWMFENVQIYTDINGNVKPNKEKSKGKIDGVVSLVMGVGQHLKHQNKQDDESLPDDFTIRSA